MTIQTKQGNLDEKISEQDVVDFLQQHPDFFDAQIPLLTELSIPHVVGGSAVSLVERQVQVLRASNKKLKKQLDDLIHIARDNDKLGRQINKMVLKIMPAEDISSLISIIEESLLRDFSADAVAIRLTITPKDAKLAERAEFVKDVPAMRRLFEKFLKDMRPMCGRLKQAQREYIFEAQAQKVASVALLPVTLGTKCIGLLAIGSHDEQRFRAGMGTAYLGHMSAFISKTLERILGK